MTTVYASSESLPFKKMRSLLLLILIVSYVVAFTTPSTTVRSQEHFGLAVENDLKRKVSSCVTYLHENKEDCGPCDNPLDNDSELDRREAAFAMLGSAWAAGFLPTALVFPQGAQAEYGADAKIELPNPVKGLEDRANKQCLVETLGNRECLVYADDSAKIYQGADNKVLLSRVEKASEALASIPELVGSKKWSKVTGVLTGPLGDLVRTMGQLAELSENSGTAKDMTKKFRNDLYAIAAAVDRKEGGKALQFHSVATNDLVAFVKAL